MSRNGKLVILGFVFLALTIFAIAIPGLILPGFFPDMSPRVTFVVAVIAIMGFVFRLGQLMFISQVTSDEPIFDLLMPWSMGNLWDDPQDHFKPGVGGAYRGFRVMVNIIGPIVVIGSVVLAIVL